MIERLDAFLNKLEASALKVCLIILSIVTIGFVLISPNKLSTICTVSIVWLLGFIIAEIIHQRNQHFKRLETDYILEQHIKNNNYWNLDAGDLTELEEDKWEEFLNIQEKQTRFDDLKIPNIFGLADKLDELKERRAHRRSQDPERPYRFGDDDDDDLLSRY